MKKITYEDIYHLFLESTSIPKDMIADCRPCISMYGVPNIPGAIVVWLKDKSTLIYIPDHRIFAETLPA